MPDPKLRWPTAPATCSGEWNSTDPHGDWVLLEFEDDFCTAARTENCVQKCMFFMPCCPSVLSVGCDTEAFCHGYNEPFPNSFTPSVVAWRWNRILVASMPDPLFEVPHLDCITNERPAYTVPYVEARCSPPAGAPAMPTNPDDSEIVFGCPSEWSWCSQRNDNECYTQANEEDI